MSFDELKFDELGFDELGFDELRLYLHYIPYIHTVPQLQTPDQQVFVLHNLTICCKKDHTYKNNYITTRLEKYFSK
jgi:hypothetical protein